MNCRGSWFTECRNGRPCRAGRWTNWISVTAYSMPIEDSHHWDREHKQMSTSTHAKRTYTHDLTPNPSSEKYLVCVCASHRSPRRLSNRCRMAAILTLAPLRACYNNGRFCTYLQRTGPANETSVWVAHSLWMVAFECAEVLWQRTEVAD